MKIVIIGYGKMGKAVEKMALAQGHIIAGIVHSAEAQNSAHILHQADVAIEFTGADSAFENIKRCIDAGVPVVCGSTGWLNTLQDAELYCKENDGTFLYASNFSIGVNIFFEINNKLAALMNKQPGYDVSIKEIHHNQKKDIPSGTAITLAEQVIGKLERKTSWSLKDDGPNILTITGERTDSAPGTHYVKYTSPIDDIEIIHTAHNRDGFAQGALLASTFIYAKKGIFTMNDVLGLRV
ncbi:MAG: 4-hydroxy-tetrahydrodipicolinate reductase [Ferruginibacter sp.]